MQVTVSIVSVDIEYMGMNWYRSSGKSLRICSMNGRTYPPSQQENARSPGRSSGIVSGVSLDEIRINLSDAPLDAMRFWILRKLGGGLAARRRISGQSTCRV